MKQIALPFAQENQMPGAAKAQKRGTRFTLKAKTVSRDALMNQIKAGWDPPDEVWRLIDWLNHEIAKGSDE
jgi:hypothetical protein